MSKTKDPDRAKTRSNEMNQFLKVLSSPIDESASRDKNFKEFKRFEKQIILN